MGNSIESLDASHDSRSSQYSQDDIEASRNSLNGVEGKRVERSFGEFTKYYEPSIAEGEAHEINSGSIENHEYENHEQIS